MARKFEKSILAGAALLALGGCNDDSCGSHKKTLRLATWEREHCQDPIDYGQYGRWDRSQGEIAACRERNDKTIMIEKKEIARTCKP